MAKATQSKVLRVLLVDEHPMMRVPLAALIDAEPDFTVCGQACSRTEALAVTKAESPDVALVGLKLHHSHGLDLIKDLHRRQPNMAVIVLTTFDGADWVERCLRAGARGFVSKKQEPVELLAAMRRVLAGECYVNNAVVPRLAKTWTGPDSAAAKLDDLPDREYQVLWYLGHGYSVREIAEHLHISVPTVETYRNRLKDKLSCDDHTDLLKSAIQWAHSSPAA